MADRKNHNGCLDRVMNELAESVLELLDEAILAETSEAGLIRSERLNARA